MVVVIVVVALRDTCKNPRRVEINRCIIMDLSLEYEHYRRADDCVQNTGIHQTRIDYSICVEPGQDSSSF